MRESYKLDLKLPDGTQIEVFSFSDALARPSDPEALGLRHLAFGVDSVEDVSIEAIRVDQYSGNKFTFFSDPDGLPLEIYEIAAQPH